MQEAPLLRRLLVGCTLWATAFGVVEGAVVVYLRQLFYPDGFTFPLRLVDESLLRVEVIREVATLIMLYGAAHAAVRRPLHRFAVFAWCFGVWDIVYYLALFGWEGWPPGLLTWDLLFLIPRPWVAPVLAPVLVSLALMGAAVTLLRVSEDEVSGRLRRVDWAVEILAGAVVLASFFWNDAAVVSGGVPASYPWWLFLVGWGGGIAWFVARMTARREPARTPR